MHVSALHAAVSRARAIATAIDVKQGPRAVAPLAAAEVDFIAFDRGTSRAMRAANQRGRFVRAHDGRDVEQPQTVDLAGTAIDAVGIGDGLAEHLITAAQSQHMAAAADMRLDVDVPSL